MKDARKWWESPRACRKCDKLFMPKVRGQKYCARHQYLAGARIRVLNTKEPHV